MDLKNTSDNPVNQYYMQIQALSQANAQETTQETAQVVGNQTAPPTTNYTLTAFYIFIGMLTVGVIGLLLTRTRDLNKLIAILVISLITSAIPLGLNLTKQKTTLTSQAGPELIPKELIVSEVTTSGFDISYSTDKAQLSIIRISTSADMKENSRILSHPQENKLSNHLIEVENLDPNTTYYTEVLSGSEWYNHNDKPLEITTLRR